MRNQILKLTEKITKLYNEPLKLEGEYTLKQSAPNLFEILNNSTSEYSREVTIKWLNKSEIEISRKPYRNLRAYLYGELDEQFQVLTIKTKPNLSTIFMAALYLLFTIVFFFEDVKVGLMMLLLFFPAVGFILLNIKMGEDNLKATITLILRHEGLIE